MCSLVKADLVWNVFSCEGGFYAGTRGVRFIQSEIGRRRGFTDTKRAFNVSWLEEAVVWRGGGGLGVRRGPDSTGREAGAGPRKTENEW
jgi:hypothetical protein